MAVVCYLLLVVCVSVCVCWFIVGGLFVVRPSLCVKCVVCGVLCIDCCLLVVFAHCLSFIVRYPLFVVWCFVECCTRLCCMLLLLWVSLRVSVVSIALCMLVVIRFLVFVACCTLLVLVCLLFCDSLFVVCW